jgi:hypothetical protein
MNRPNQITALVVNPTHDWGFRYFKYHGKVGCWPPLLFGYLLTHPLLRLPNCSDRDILKTYKALQLLLTAYREYVVSLVPHLLVQDGSADLLS